MNPELALCPRPDKRNANGAFGYGQFHTLKIAKRIVRDGVSLTIALPFSRRLLNSLYVRLTPAQRVQFYLRLAKIFRNNRIRGRNGSWDVVFANKRIEMPLTADRFWLDWD